MLLPDEKLTSHRNASGGVQLREPAYKPLIPKSLLNRLYQEDPSHRRRVYIKYSAKQARDVVQTLYQSGFEMKTMSIPQGYDPMPSMPSAYYCVITGSTTSILRFVESNPDVLGFSIHFPEYGWLSSAPGNTADPPDGL